MTSSASRRSILDGMAIGDQIVLPAPKGVASLMQSLSADFSRMKPKRFQRRAILGVLLDTKEVLELVQVTRMDAL